MGAELDKQPGSTHYNRDQWVWWRVKETGVGPDTHWTARIGYLEDPHGQLLSGYPTRDSAHSDCVGRAHSLLHARRQELHDGFRRRGVFTIGDSGIKCRPNTTDPGWHIGANGGTEYGRGLFFGKKGEDRNPSEQLEDFEDACMECAVALRKRAEQGLSAEQLARELRMPSGSKLAQALREVLDHRQQRRLISRYQELVGKPYDS